jgi:hypothetical protein
MQGPPADEIIARIADALSVDHVELAKAAGRGIDDFEGRVLKELRELRAGLGRIERAVSGPRQRS